MYEALSPPMVDECWLTLNVSETGSICVVEERMQ